MEIISLTGTVIGLISLILSAISIIYENTTNTDTNENDYSIIVIYKNGKKMCKIVM